ncbi:TonB-dependent hemoglobin/transferrin/lactoferrin family receptor [Lysobacter pythonis]|uniref:TonB-dependent hemoglobin/transferrin/lactoferrin family receptor n=1 Tax=Solilutibacter pythonis TaxID=2483112 RepID=A0A3M2HZI8_9GAMM|nr:TonB-dependent hemoglobin/transferrin/lactoferrin family receptor [Lysobacter pythonis]
MQPTRRVLALSILLALSPATHAAEGSGAEAAASLDRVTVHGQRLKKRSANQNVERVDDKRLAEEIANRLEDVIRYIPGVEIVDMGRFGENGFNIRGLESDRVSMSIDGLDLAESLETARDYEFFRAGRGGPDIDTLKRVEIVKGADGIGLGSGALGGGVAFVSKDPRDYLAAKGNDTHLGLKLGYASASREKMGTASFANRGGIVESMLVHTRRNGQETRGWYADTRAETGSSRRIPDPVDRDSRNWLGKLDFVLSEAHRVGIVAERSLGEARVENLSRVSPPGYLQRWGDDRNQRDRYGLRWHWRAGHALFDTLEAQADWQKTESTGLTRILAGRGCPGGTAPCWRSENRASRQRQNRIAFDFDKAIDGDVRHRIGYGLAWQRRKVDFSSIDTRWRADGGVASVEIDPSQVPETTVGSWNLYLRDRMRLADGRFGLTLGARYDRYDYTPKTSPTFTDPLGAMVPVRFAAPSWQTGLDWRITGNQTLWLQAGSGFRAPTVANMYSPISYSNATVVATGETVRYWTNAPNPDLKAETSLNLELGWRWQGEMARWGVSVFRDRYSDFIEAVETVRNAGTQYQICDFRGCRVTDGNRYYRPENFGQVTVKGYELDSQVRFGTSWSLRMAWSQTRGEQRNGTPLDSINPARGVIGLRWNSADARWSIGGHLTHALAKKRRDTTVRTDPFTGKAMERFVSPAWTVVDLIASFQPSPQWRINAGVYNLFDREYATWPRIRMVGRGNFALYGYATDEGFGRLTQPGRNARLSVAYTF